MQFPDAHTAALAGARPIQVPARRTRIPAVPQRKGRNTRQAAVEVPLMIRALGLPRGAECWKSGAGEVSRCRSSHGCCVRRASRAGPGAGLSGRGAPSADARGVEAELVPGDIRRMPFPDASFDLVVDFGTCYHIARAARRSPRWRGCSRPAGCSRTRRR